MATFTNITIHGCIVGALYWPYGVTAWKDCVIDVKRERSRISGDGRATLRDVVNLWLMENDGDFCGSAVIAQGTLTATRTETRGDGRRITVTRSWPLEQFPSIADCLHPDPDWMPMDFEDYADAA